jgi:shikimate kinase
MERRADLIYLTGFMGSGKSTVGPILANSLGYASVDIDREIEERAGKSVSAIFKESGEEYFRNLERSVLTELSTRSGCVVSLGGGTVTNDANLHIVKTTGILVYLKVSDEQLTLRLKHKTDRPLLASLPAGASIEVVRQHISALRERREPYYAQADVIVDIDGKRVGVTIDLIMQRLRRFSSHTRH